MGEGVDTVEAGRSELAAPERMRVAARATWISAGVNAALTLGQLLVGWLAHSQSLIAHGLHSASDLLSDFLVLYANRRGHQPADADHPYGHARMETAATLLLGISLFAIGLGILWDAVGKLRDIGTVEAVGQLALWVAVVTVLAKEALYRYLIAVADRLRSKMLAANALHTRADAASALVVVAGVGGSLAGWPFLDLLAAILMGGMILKLGVELAWGAMTELIDTGLDTDEVAKIRAVLAETPGVRGVHELKTRRMAHRALVEAHLQVDARISVSEGHHIAESARARVLRAMPQVLDVLVHIDPEDDSLPPAARPPARRHVQAALDELLAGLPRPSRVVVHYLQGGMEAEVFFAADIASGEQLADWRAQLATRLSGQQLFVSICLHRAGAPIRCAQ
jgi:cation diffusion facilitator family transporter